MEPIRKGITSWCLFWVSVCLYCHCLWKSDSNVVSLLFTDRLGIFLKTSRTSALYWDSTTIISCLELPEFSTDQLPDHSSCRQLLDCYISFYTSHINNCTCYKYPLLHTHSLVYVLLQSATSNSMCLTM